MSTPEYCTVLNTLLMVARISRLRVSPSPTVFDSAILFCTVPGPVIKFRGAFPNVPHGYSGSGAGSLNAEVLNHCRPELNCSGAPVKLGLKVPPVPHATLS